MTDGSGEKVVIVGAGPAGIRAAEVLVQAGIRPVVIDEGFKGGGQIYRRPPEGFTRSPQQLYGSEAHKAVALHSLFDRMVAVGAIDYHSQSSVLSTAGNLLQALTPAGRMDFTYSRLILATGAMDRLAPVPGWQAPGVYRHPAAEGWREYRGSPRHILVSEPSVGIAWHAGEAHPGFERHLDAVKARPALPCRCDAGADRDR
jgi:NADPH-dependent 2,4-dienoyl-CoA reductase/sulfur reductase-like enzyme